MIQYLIYMHTSMKSGKSYIGMTSRTLDKRWSEHVREASYGSLRHFHNAINIYGKENWNHEVLLDCIDTLEEAFQLERFMIKKYDTFENGYNLSGGGEGRVGLQSPEYFEIHTWQHKDHGAVVATGATIIEDYKVPIHVMYPYLIKQKKPSRQASGWVIKGKDKLPIPKLSCDDMLVAYHKDGSTYKGTIGDFSVLIDKPIKHIGKVISGKHKTICGWGLLKEQAARSTSNKKVYAYSTTDGMLLATYESSFSASTILRLSRKALMSEWLSYTGNCKIHKGIRYTYTNESLTVDKNIGVVQ